MTPSSRPPLALRLAAAALRNLPRVRGRGRLELSLHRALGGHRWQESVCVHGALMDVALDDLVGRTLYLNGEFEPTGTSTARALVPKGSVVFDVGAHVGYYTLLFSRLTGPGGAVHAFEPVLETAARLKSNVLRRASPEAEVQVHELALSDRSGRVAMNISGETNTGASHVAAAPVDDRDRCAAGVVRTVDVPCGTGDEIWSGLGRPPVAVVKIDVEGHELHVLRGMRELLASEGCVVLTEIRERFLRGAGSTREELFAFMSGLDFASYDFIPAEKRFARNPTPRDAEMAVFSRRPL